MRLLHYVVFALVGVAVVSLYMAVVAVMRKDPVRERLKRALPAGGTAQADASLEEDRTDFFLFCNNLLRLCGVDVAAARRQLYLPMIRAGLNAQSAVVYYLFFKWFIQPLLVAVGLFLIVQLAFIPDASTVEQLLHVLLGGIVMTMGLDGARTYLNSLTDRRKRVLQQSFPEALDLMLICVEAGLPLDAALARVCRELKKTHPEITQELDRTRIEINVLNDRVQALNNLAERTNIPGFKTLVAAMIQTEKIGSSMAETLRVLAGEYRLSRMVAAEAKAARIPALITVPLIFFIMPAFMLIIMAPLAIRIAQQGGLFPEINAIPTVR